MTNRDRDKALRIACVLAWEEYIDAAQAGSPFEDPGEAQALVDCIESVLSGAYSDQERALLSFRSMFQVVEEGSE